MSIFVKNVQWSQNESEICINLTLKSTKSIDDIVIAEKFLKVNARPYFYELFFEEPICAEQSTCKILESNIKFRLKKCNSNQWNNLGYTAKSGGNEGNEIASSGLKKQIFDEYEKSMKDSFESKQKERMNLKRIEIDKEIERGSQIRKKIQETEAKLKDCQLQKVSRNDENLKFIPKNDANSIELQRENLAKAIERKTVPDQVSNSNRIEEHIELPPIRSSGKIGVELSTREFITPKRESQENAEREWCAKQHQVMHKLTGLSDDDLNSDECDVFWLLKKGHEFLEKKNYLAAVSAFSCGLNVSKDSPDIYLGRARAQYALKNYQRCAEDCSEALEKFKPAVESNLLSRIHCFWLRGKSLISLGLTSHGERELQMAARLDPQNFEENQMKFLASN